MANKGKGLSLILNTQMSNDMITMVGALLTAYLAKK